jgi:hypothetical protein
METITPEQRDAMFGTFAREALHLEMRDVYAVPSEAKPFARFLELGRRDDEADAAERHAWITLMRNATQAGKRVRRARVVSEPVTDYIRFEWSGTHYNVEAGEEVRWLPRRLASAIALPGNDFWLFDGEVVAFTVFTGDGDVAEHQLTADHDIVRLCRSAFEAVWAVATPHADYRLR